MRIVDVLRVKGDEVATIGPDATVTELLAGLCWRNIGAMVVVDPADGDAVVGIVSERDIVRELGKRGAACLGDKVESLMTAYEIGIASVQEHIDRQLLAIEANAEKA